jgi:hypothetical protein
MLAFGLQHLFSQNSKATYRLAQFSLVVKCGNAALEWASLKTVSSEFDRSLFRDGSMLSVGELGNHLRLGAPRSMPGISKGTRA